MPILISVVIPTYNDPPLNCLKALAKQTIHQSDYEAIVVDNASTKIDIKNTVTQFKFAKYLKEPRKGAYYARNTGWKKAEGDIVAFTDADCIPDKRWLEEILTSFNNPKVVAIGGSIRKTIPYSWIERNQKCLADGQTKLRYKTYSKLPYIIAANMIFKKSLLRELNGFDEAYTSGGDVDFSWRVILKGYSIKINTKANIFHYPRSSLKDYYKQYYRYGIGHPFLFKKHHGGYFYFDLNNITGIPLNLFKMLTVGLFKYSISFGKNESIFYYFLEVIKITGLISGRIKGSIKYRVFFV